MKISENVLEILGIDEHDTGDVQVPCPFHLDTNPSASFNMEKGVLNCFTCGRGWSAAQVETELALVAAAEPEAVEEVESVEVTPLGKQRSALAKAARALLSERGIKQARSAVRFGLGGEDGYLFFGQWDKEDWPVGKCLTGDGPRYWNQPGEKDLFWLARPEDPDRGVWLTEGVLDALALREVMPRSQVAVALGANGLTDQGAYALRGLTVFVAYDRDFAGYRGTQKAIEKLIEFDASPIEVELPKRMGKDFGEALQNHEEAFRQWALGQETQFSNDDQAWVHSTFAKGEAPPLKRLTTTIATWDRLLGGGFSEGVHAVGAETGAGKTSWATRAAVTWATVGHRVLFVTNEIPKRQQWARVASCEDEQEWNNIEVDPTIVSKSTLAWLEKVSMNLRVVAGWDIGRIKYAAPDYDAIVVDYLQRMPEVYGGDAAERRSIEYNITQLSNLARDGGKVVIAVQRLRNEQGKAGIESFYGSSAIRYVVQSGTVFRALPSQQRIVVDVGKNTRGEIGQIAVETELGNQRFIDRGPVVIGGPAGHYEVSEEALG